MALAGDHRASRSASSGCCPGLDDAGASALPAHVFHVVAGFALVAAFIVAGLFYGPRRRARQDRSACRRRARRPICSARHAAGARRAGTTPLALDRFHRCSPSRRVAIAWRTEAAAAAVPVAAVLAVLVMLRWAVDVEFDQLIAPGRPGRTARCRSRDAALGPHLVLGAGFAALFGAAGFLAQGRSDAPIVPILWARAGGVDAAR